MELSFFGSVVLGSKVQGSEIADLVVAQLKLIPLGKFDAMNSEALNDFGRKLTLNPER
jgi:hypothetical protein